MYDKPLRIGPPISDKPVKIAITTFVAGFYLTLLVAGVIEVRQELANHRPGTPHFDPIQTSPEAQKQLFSLR